MRLLLHNFLDCNIKTVKNGYPLKIEAEKVKEIEVDYDPDFLRHMYSRIDYKALREAAETLGKVCFSVCVAGIACCCWSWAKQLAQRAQRKAVAEVATGHPLVTERVFLRPTSSLLGAGLAGLPVEASAASLEDEDFLRTLHHVLLEVVVEEGALICPETGRRFPVVKCIPNMLLNEDEC